LGDEQWNRAIRHGFSNDLVRFTIPGESSPSIQANLLAHPNPRRETVVALEMLVVVAALSAGETVLLEFSSQYCGPCKSMAPVVRRLASDGYPVRAVDVDQQRELAGQYRVTGVPCFVMLANGREVDRVVGATSYDRLTQMFQTARFRPPGSEGEQVRGQSPDGGKLPGPGGSRAPDLLQRINSRQASLAAERVAETRYDEISSGPAGAAQPPAAAVPGQAANQAPPQERAMQASVRLTIDEGKFTSHGTGTIIDTHDDEALVLTCGHIFRDSKGKGEISVSFCTAGLPQAVAGHLIAYNLERDVALVSIRPGTAVAAMQVAPPSYRPQRGGRVFSIGCDHGREARLVPSRISAIDKFTGPANIEVAGAPAEGRSGGGLFTEDGLLIGVCNAADPADNEGLYAALPSVHWQLAQIGQEAIFERAEMAVARERASQPMHADAVAQSEVAAPPGMADQMPRPREAPGSVAEPPRGNPFTTGDSEIICIVRSKNNPQGRSETFVLDRPSPELLNRLSQEYNQLPTGSRISARPAAKNVFRAQSSDK
jgi:thiol-disulfide isomerase/thioredoxin